jgi:hypothetical protein
VRYLYQLYRNEEENQVWYDFKLILSTISRQEKKEISIRTAIFDLIKAYVEKNKDILPYLKEENGKERT